MSLALGATWMRVGRDDGRVGVRNMCMEASATTWVFLRDACIAFAWCCVGVLRDVGVYERVWRGVVIGRI